MEDGFKTDIACESINVFLKVSQWIIIFEIDVYVVSEEYVLLMRCSDLGSEVIVNGVCCEGELFLGWNHVVGEVDVFPEGI